ncbi:hypothetical protein [Ureibacillus aquaedulcis]|uniref:Uncharacterized protein n=1 Tax=Ureibacillus aquaedulcis TaxID=3058421 RepID=A0ABT8GSG9_9BACL|nr:hypothetical protein [Ureibacillus sp. BA0131]MDN4494349.1 hypothetical protein [Ureibacillus sp. BA0131]
MPRKPTQTNEDPENEKMENTPNNLQSEIDNLSRMLAAVLDYLADEENEEIDIEYLFDKTEGLREWRKQHQEKNRKLIEEEIKKSLGDLSFEDLQKIREQIKEK